MILKKRAGIAALALAALSASLAAAAQPSGTASAPAALQQRGAAVALSNGCTGCHGANLGGQKIGAWLAPNITPDRVSGIGAWTPQQLRAYLQTGDARGVAQAAGPMAQVVERLSTLSNGDREALIAWLHARPAVHNPADTAAADSFGKPSNAEAQYRGSAATSVPVGFSLYSGSCASCHGVDGAGSRDGTYPSLYHNTAVGRRDPSNLIATLLEGVERKTSHGAAFMPSFDISSGPPSSLTVTEMAEVATYVRSQFGDPSAPPVTSAMVTVARAGK